MKDEPEQQTDERIRYGITPVSLAYVGPWLLVLFGVPLLTNAILLFFGWFSSLVGN